MELVRDSNGLTRSGTSWRISAVSLVVLVTLAFSTFGEILGHGFVRWDDDLHITENPLLNPPRWSHLGRFWRESYEDLYIPLSYLFFAGEVSIADGLFPRESDAPPHPLVFKAVSLLLHLTCTWFVWMLVWRWAGNPWGALGGATLFCIHPVQVESVAWTSETRGLLASLLGLGALLLHRPASSKSSEIGPGRWREFLALLLFVGGLLAKPTIVVLAPVIVAVDRLVGGLPWRRVVLGSLPWWLVAVAAFLLTRWMQPASSLLFQASLADRLQIACDAVAVHVAHLLWPWPLGIDYGRTPGVAINGGWWLLGLIFPGICQSGCVAITIAGSTGCTAVSGRTFADAGAATIRFSIDLHCGGSLCLSRDARAGFGIRTYCGRRKANELDCSRRGSPSAALCDDSLAG